MIPKYIIGLFFLSQLIHAQNTEALIKNKLNKIDSIVELINKNADNYPEGIMEGPIIYSGLFKKNGGWEAYDLRESDSVPLRIRYNLALKKTYENYEFYYSNGNLIYIYLNVTYYKRKKKNKSFEKKLYIEDSTIIFDNNPEINDYKAKNILKTAKTFRKFMFE